MPEIRDMSGSRFEQLNLSGTRVHSAFLIDTKVTDAWVHSLDLSGNIQSLVVNGVEVAGYVRAELERRHPELGYLDSKDVPGLQRAWAKVQQIAAATLDAARRLPPAMLDESVDDEYSYLQTLRHLVFATDRWITGPVLGDADQFHPLGYPYNSAPPAERAPLDLDANPTFDDVLEVRAERTGFVDTLVRDATDESLARVVDSPNGGTTTVGDCIRVVMRDLQAAQDARPPRAGATPTRHSARRDCSGGPPSTISARRRPWPHGTFEAPATPQRRRHRRPRSP